MKKYLLLLLASSLQSATIQDYSSLHTAQVQAIFAPTTIQELQTIVRTTPGKIAIAGGRFSQGGQIYSEAGTVIDITNLNKITNFDQAAKTITVQSGMRWMDIQAFIDPYDLAVIVMQSYCNFTVGGSLGVNVHGRYLGHGPLVETVLSLKIVLADGSLVTASRTLNPDLFAAAIGGYGALGIIVEATLQLTDNHKMERRAMCLPVVDYPEQFKTIEKNPLTVLHNADLYPPYYDTITSITWYKTDKEPTVAQRLKAHKSWSLLDHLKMGIVKRLPMIQKSRPSLEALNLTKATVVWRNYEAGYHTDELYYPQLFSVSLLQEFFIPVDQILPFLESLKRILTDHEMNVLNISLRHVAPNNESLLSWSNKESFAVVLFYDQWKTEKALNNADICFARLIEAAIAVGGTYYLPYKLIASQNQFERAYPRHREFWAIKKAYDPTEKFSNTMWEHYFKANSNAQ